MPRAKIQKIQKQVERRLIARTIEFITQIMSKQTNKFYKCIREITYRSFLLSPVENSVCDTSFAANMKFLIPFAYIKAVFRFSRNKTHFPITITTKPSNFYSPSR